MLFNSWSFALFLPIVFALYWLIPTKFRWIVLLVASYYFYMSWNPVYVVLILFVTVLSYTMSLLIKNSDSVKKRKWFVAITAIASLGVLFVFKYYNFFMDSFVLLMKSVGLHFHVGTLRVLLPVGISFYTFQTISYVVDVYRSKVEPERNFGIYATFVAFFPQLVAGPIERASNLLPQIASHHVFDYHQATYGLKLMAWGFFKKIVVADTLAGIVDSIYENPDTSSGFTFVLVTVFFAIQIYGDFSGYSDIAVGCGKLFGINLMDNFHSPYLATSLKDFWAKWHISLSGWFKDYVYIPLGGNRCGKLRRSFNLIVTFLASGIWHGANWTYLAWGAVHGVARAGENICNDLRKSIHSRRLAQGKQVRPLPEDKGYPHTFSGWISALVTFIFAAMAFVIFRAENIRQASMIFSNYFMGITSPVSYLVNGVHGCGMSIDECVSVLIMVVAVFVFDYFNLRTNVIRKISSLKPVLRWTIYVAFLIFALYLLPVQAGGEFIYFQF